VKPEYLIFVKSESHSALEEHERRLLQHIRCNAHHFYSYLFLFVLKIIALKTFLYFIVLSILYTFISIKFYDKYSIVKE
jgi:hypothetical protein